MAGVWSGSNLAPPPPPVHRGMDGPPVRAMQAGVTQGASGHISWALGSYPWHKHPHNQPPAVEGPYVRGAPVLIDTLSLGPSGPDPLTAKFEINWEYNGLSLGNVRIANIGTDQSGRTLAVDAQVIDEDDLFYRPSNCAGLRVRFRFIYSGGGRGDAFRTVNVYLRGDGLPAIVRDHWE
jgi:hypothetical protein